MSRLYALVLLHLFVGISVGQTSEPEIARGRVFLDANSNRQLDDGEQGLSGIRVSNGREIVKTDARGEYSLPVTNDSIVFVIKPSGYRTPLSDQQTPEFYYIHKPEGSPRLKYEGVAPTGSLPGSIDFPLYRQDEPDVFRAIMFGDPQPRNQQEIDYIAHDVVEELIETDAAMGVTLGDILFDDLSLFESQGKTIGLVGIPWYNVIGNHDINYDAPERRFANETFEKFYGPSYYSFDYGQVHFLVLDDIDWVVPEQGSDAKAHYEAGLGEDQLRFIETDLKEVPDEKLVVLMMHIPITQIKDRESLYRLIEKRPFCMSISGHTHHHEHRFLKKADGWQGASPHHHVINVTVSGSWWSGNVNEWGIPHTTMADGAPNGYSIISFDGSEYRVEFRAAGRPAKYQMNITAPEVIDAAEAGETEIYVNVFNGSERTQVQLRVGKSDEWLKMERTVEKDPGYIQAFEREASIEQRNTPKMSAPKASTHLWKVKLPSEIELGPQLIHIRSKDPDGQTHDAYRVIRIEASGK
jgi:hypothetical protein